MNPEWEGYKFEARSDVSKLISLLKNKSLNKKRIGHWLFIEPATY